MGKKGKRKPRPICPVCGEHQVATSLSTGKILKTCSPECARKLQGNRGMWLKPRPPCLNCGKPVATSRFRQILKTCSYECMVALRAARLKRNWERTRQVRDGRDVELSLRLRQKLLVISHYSNGTMKCYCCGEMSIEFMTIDHLNGDGLKHRKEIGKGKASGGNFYRWLIRNGYPSGFGVLCQNCNFSRGLFGYCPHQYKDGMTPLAVKMARSAKLADPHCCAAVQEDSVGSCCGDSVSQPLDEDEGA